MGIPRHLSAGHDGRLTDQQMPGGLVDLDKTATLNHLAAEGWEVIGMTGSVGADHAVYLRRASAHQGPQ